MSQPTKRNSILQWIKQSRAFIYSLLAVTIVWIASSMSESKSYRETYPVVYDGFDMARYAVIHMDSTLTLSVGSNGFRAFQRGRNQKPLLIDISPMLRQRQASLDTGTTLFVVSTEEYIDSIRQQIDMRGVAELRPIGDQLTIQLAPRHFKKVPVNIDDVHFTFDGMSGICGSPSVKSDSITVYGSKASIDKIDQIRAKSVTLNNIRVSGNYQLSLDGQWRNYPDVRLSDTTVLVYLPVEEFIEKEYPVTVSANAIGGDKVRLYPSTVTLKVLVPRGKYDRLTPDDFTVTTSPTSDSSSFLYPVVRQFPTGTRIKSISPNKIQYVIIQK